MNPDAGLPMISVDTSLEQRSAILLEEMRKQILTKYNESHNCKKTWQEMRNTDWEWYQKNVIDLIATCELSRLYVFEIYIN